MRENNLKKDLNLTPQNTNIYVFVNVAFKVYPVDESKMTYYFIFYIFLVAQFDWVIVTMATRRTCGKFRYYVCAIPWSDTQFRHESAQT